MTATPATIARIVISDRNRAATAARDRYLVARRRDAAHRGYRGPLTRDELARMTARQADLPAGRNLPR